MGLYDRNAGQRGSCAKKLARGPIRENFAAVQKQPCLRDPVIGNMQQQKKKVKTFHTYIEGYEAGKANALKRGFFTYFVMLRGSSPSGHIGTGELKKKIESFIYVYHIGKKARECCRRNGTYRLSFFFASSKREGSKPFENEVAIHQEKRERGIYKRASAASSSRFYKSQLSPSR